MGVGVASAGGDRDRPWTREGGLMQWTKDWTLDVQLQGTVSAAFQPPGRITRHGQRSAPASRALPQRLCMYSLLCTHSTQLSGRSLAGQHRSCSTVHQLNWRIKNQGGSREIHPVCFIRDSVNFALEVSLNYFRNVPYFVS